MPVAWPWHGPVVRVVFVVVVVVVVVVGARRAVVPWVLWPMRRVLRLGRAVERVARVVWWGVARGAAEVRAERRMIGMLKSV